MNQANGISQLSQNRIEGTQTNNKTISAVRKFKKILTNEVDVNGHIDISIVVTRYLAKLAFRKIDIEEFDRRNQLTMNLYNDEIKGIFLKMIDKFRKAVRVNNCKYIDFIKSINNDIDNNIHITELLIVIKKWFDNNGMTDLYATFESSLKQILEKGENINLVVYFNNEVRQLKIATGDEKNDKISERSITELLYLINKGLHNIVTKFPEVEGGINKIVVVGDSKLLDIERDILNIKIIELLTIDQLEDSYFSQKEFSELDKDDNNEIKSVITKLILKLNDLFDSPVNLMSNIFDGFKVKNNSIQLYFNASKAEKKQIRDIMDTPDYKNCIAEISESTGYNMHINFPNKK